MQWIASCCSTKTLWWWFVIKMEGAWLFANAQILAWSHGMFEFACVTIPGQFIKKAVLIKADNRVWWLCSEIRRVLLGILFSGKETKRIFICVYFANLNIEYNYFFSLCTYRGLKWFHVTDTLQHAELLQCFCFHKLISSSYCKPTWVLNLPGKI